MAHVLEYSRRRPRFRSEAARAAFVFALGCIPTALVAWFIAFDTPLSDVVVLPARRGWRAQASAPLVGAAVIAVAAGVLCFLGIKVRERIAPRPLFARS